MSEWEHKEEKRQKREKKNKNNIRINEFLFTSIVIECASHFVENLFSNRMKLFISSASADCHFINMESCEINIKLNVW